MKYFYHVCHPILFTFYSHQMWVCLNRKNFFSKVCCQYMAKNPGRVITEDILAAFACDVFAQSHTPLNILGGFKKAGIYPSNLGEVSDRLRRHLQNQPSQFRHSLKNKSHDAPPTPYFHKWLTEESFSKTFFCKCVPQHVHYTDH